MPDIMIEVWDATGNKRQQVEVPAESEVNRVIAVLVDRMTLPRHSPDGQMMSYKFHHKASGRQLLDTQTLADAGVSNGDILRLQPEITAGSLPACSFQSQNHRQTNSGQRYV
ncbi:MAG: EsaB/YukD family protein [Rhodopirellula sp.]|nr:EsaB/YukD family protein [Rhodopirellula sp.]